MIPVRVMVRGFLSYRDRAEIVFDNGRLWMLSGSNGAGKSAVFDAITFALFGFGRFGNGAVSEYIHHDSPDMEIEFDFDFDGQRYRVKRTAHQKRRSSYQAYTLDRANPNATPTPVQETGSESGLDAWIKRTTNVECGTYRASALLRQGESDRLLMVTDGKERAAIMSGIIDLSAYEKLHGVVNAQANTLENEANALRRRMDALETHIKTAAGKAVSDFTLPASEYPLLQHWLAEAKLIAARLAEIEQEAEEEAARLQKQSDALNRISVALSSWQANQMKRAELHERKATYAAIQKRRADIEQRAARLRELTATIPAREAWRKARTDWRTANKKREEAIGAIERLTEAVAECSRQLPLEQAALQQAQARQTAAVSTLAVAQNELKTLETRRAELEKADGIAECQVCGKPLAEEQRQEQIKLIDVKLVAARQDATNAKAEKNAADKAVTSAIQQVEATKGKIASIRQNITSGEKDRGLAERDRQSAAEKAGRALDSLKEAFDGCAALTVNGQPYTPKDLVGLILADGDAANALQNGVYPNDAVMEGTRQECKTLAGADEDKTKLDEADQKTAQIELEMTGYVAQIATNGDQVKEDAQALEEGRQESILDVLATAAQDTDDICDNYSGIAELPDAAQRDQKRAAASQHLMQSASAAGATVKEWTQETECRRKTAGEAAKQARDTRQTLQSSCDEYDHVEGEWRDTARQHKAYKTLADKLHRTSLQSWLRVAAEQSIVANANQTLQRLSSGMLAMRLADGGGQTLDLRLTDHQKGGEGARDLRPQALSGSQKFRVSVALALGIGQYACGQSRGGIKSVIIDEGFGSLDKENLKLIVEELPKLGEVLERIIVVSHQEGFEAQFPNRWHIVVDNGTSTANLVQ